MAAWDLKVVKAAAEGAAALRSFGVANRGKWSRRFCYVKALLKG